MQLRVQKKASFKVSVPVSAVQMEYKCSKKPPVVKEMAANLVAECKKYTSEVEFSAEDAVRAEPEFLNDVMLLISLPKRKILRRLRLLSR